MGYPLNATTETIYTVDLGNGVYGTVAPSTNRQFADGYFEPAYFPLTTNSIVTPRPDAETHIFSYVRNGFVGMVYELKINIFGGAFPHYFTILEAPEGTTLGETIFDEDYGVIKWTPSQNGIVTFRIQITDQDQDTQIREWTVNVNEDWIRFVDINAIDNSGDGSFSNPWKNLAYALDNVVDGRCICLRGGTYADAMTGKSVGTSFANAVIGYNNEVAIIDMVNYENTGGQAVFMCNSSDWTLFNVTLRNPPTNMNNPRWQQTFTVTHRMIMDKVVVENNGRLGLVNDDNISVMFLGDGGATRQFCSQTRCVFEGFAGAANGWSCIDTYDTQYLVVEENIFRNQSTSAGTGAGVVWMKATGTRDVTIRRNIVEDEWLGNIFELQLSNNSGLDNFTGNIEVCYNKMYGSTTQSTNNIVFGIGRGTGNNIRSPVYSYRNTIYGNCAIWVGRTYPLTFSSVKDVIVSDATYTNQASTGHKILGRDENTADNVWVNPTTRTNFTFNVLNTECHGVVADSIVDANLNLTGSYEQYVGTRGAEINSGN